MKARLPLVTLAATLALSACSKSSDEPEVVASTPAVAETAQVVPLAEPVESEAAPMPSATPSASDAAADDAIPPAIHGRWGLVPADCTSKLGDAKGLLTVSARQLKFYESVAKLDRVKEVEGGRIRGAFTYSGEGQTWTQDVVLDVQDGGKTLIRRDYGKDALPGPLTYTRCT
ncbi:hypothetical protein ABVV53_04170 [Novosphingobium sp. RD2P27]|uniref:Lipoprotein n=1 Tax=Novosphingobium kalidii TaxID=3230299 RepID=A0ABV2CYH7_9SPHN